MKIFLKLFITGLVFSLVLFTISVIALAGLYVYLSPQLPSIEGLSDVRLQVPLRIYSSDGSLLGEFGEKRRSPKSLDEIPLRMRRAFLSAEDDRFFEHPGVDYQGILRAVINLISTGERGQGGSTITQQLVKNFYLSSERTLTRKLNEAAMALMLEWHYSKDEILEAYLNEVYLGQDGNRAVHGFGLASHFYFERPLAELSIEQFALLVGLVKGPSYYNPRRHPERARERRNLVLGVMADLGLVTVDEATRAKSRKLGVSRYRRTAINTFPAFLDLVRRQLRRDYNEDDLVSEGLRIFTTLSPSEQEKAQRAVSRGLDDLAQEGMLLIEQIAEIYSNYAYDTEIIVASVRHPLHVLESALIGADWIDSYTIFMDATDGTNLQITGDQAGNPPPRRLQPRARHHRRPDRAAQPLSTARFRLLVEKSSWYPKIPDGWDRGKNTAPPASASAGPAPLRLRIHTGLKASWPCLYAGTSRSRQNRKPTQGRCHQ